MESFTTDILSQGQSIKWGHEVSAREVVNVNCVHERLFDIFSHLKGLVEHQKGDRGKNILQVWGDGFIKRTKIFLRITRYLFRIPIS